MNVTKALIAVTTVRGSQTYGTSTPVFAGTFTKPTKATVNGTVSCTEVASPTRAISAGLAAGTYTLKASSCGGLTATTGDYVFTYAAKATGFTVAKATQVITFAGPGQGLAGSTATLTATGGASGNVVTFTIDPSSGAGVCSVSGSTVAYMKPGTCVLDANQAGNQDYDPAPQVAQSVTVTSPPSGYDLVGSDGGVFVFPTGPSAATTARCRQRTSSPPPRSWAWSRPPPIRATSSWAPTAACSPSATHRSWVPFPG